MIDLARNPAAAAAMNATTGLFTIVPSNGAAFQNQLSAAPPDWSLAIVYLSTALPAQYFIALDANDTAYAGASGSANIAASAPTAQPPRHIPPVRSVPRHVRSHRMLSATSGYRLQVGRHDDERISVFGSFGRGPYGDISHH